MALGYGLWLWLAAPLAFRTVSEVLFMEARMIFYLTYPARRLVRKAVHSGRESWRVLTNKLKKKLNRHRKPPPTNPS